MPEDDNEPAHIMSFPRIERIIRVAGSLGVKKLKITGGEPLVHPEVTQIIRLAKNSSQIANVTLTTNGLLLATLAADLIDAGLDAVNVSLDTLDPARFEALTRRDYLPRVLAGLSRVLDKPGKLSVKVNCVPTASSPIKDLMSLAALAKDHDLHVRFIELMPIGLGKGQERLDPEILQKELAQAFGPLTPVSRTLGNGPATYYALEGFKGRIGFINAVKSCFCDRCNRIRITADGCFKTCLHMDRGLFLPLDDEAAMARAMIEAVYKKPLSHSFTKEAEAADERIMSRIGG
jgi:cyclic pyranopterin phosphate synthase